MKKLILGIALTTFLIFSSFPILAQMRTTVNLDSWKFSRGDHENAFLEDFDDNAWNAVSVPHDWAIYGPFDPEIDKQTVKITQNNEEIATVKTGRTGALPFVGVGWYRTWFNLDEMNTENRVLLTFDGAMSNAEVFVNGVKMGTRPYGYSYFYFDITEQLTMSEPNLVAVRLENLPYSSRWYPGAGLYRKVQLIVKNEACFKHWGHFITTPFISDSMARVKIVSDVSGSNLTVETAIYDPAGNQVAKEAFSKRFGDQIEQNLEVTDPKLWSPETPFLYTAKITLFENGEVRDEEKIRFGIRKIEYSSSEGFKLNGEVTKFKGVCLHHDLGPLGTAVNTAALKRQLVILKDLGCNAIRSAHNMPSIEQLELCDELGFLFIAESFDEWKKPKVKNGYNLYFDEWAEKDVVNLVRATRNHPCIVMWSAGNEVPDQWGSEGVKRLKWLQDIFHREDPTRPVTVGMDQVQSVMENGFGAILDVPGLNYRVHLYEEAFEKFPQGFLLGSETASTVSSRGVYKFPAEVAVGKKYSDGQCSSYDLEYCNWSNLPEDDFILQDEKDWVIGEFVWTGFDYLGEPTPYDDYWPSRSSYFGICDLAGLPKDRYYLYRSRWNENEETLHILPHWNWPGREGEVTPVFVYTSHHSAELFVNGVSQGVKTKNDKTKFNRYRLMWEDVKYEAGTLKVLACDENGKVVGEKEVHTAGKPHHLSLHADRKLIHANGNDLTFVTVSVLDKDGIICPTAYNQLDFEVKGEGVFRAACNGDATSLEMFHVPTMKAFNGKLVVIVQSTDEPGDIVLVVRGKGLKTGSLEIKAVKNERVK